MINRMKKNTNKLIIAVMVFVLSVLSIYIGLNAVNLSKIKTDEDLWRLTQNPDKWYGFNPNDIIDKNLELTLSSLIFRRGAYCIDHHTGNILDENIPGGYYSVRHFIDINVGDLGTEEIKVYGNGKPRVYNVKEKAGAKNALELAYAAEESFREKETSISVPESKDRFGYAKITMQNIFGASAQNFKRDLKFRESFVLGINPGQQFTGWDEIEELTKKASNYANSIVPNVTLEDISEEGKQNIRTVEGKTYIGPYKVLISGITIENISITTIEGEKLKASGISEKVNGEVQSVNTIKNKKEFYIVVNKKISNAEKVELKTQTQKVIKARMAFLTGGHVAGQASQNLIFFRAEEVDKPITLNVPKVEKPKTGDLEIIKKTLGNEKNYLQGVGFIIRNIEQDKYVRQDKNGEITYVDKKEATEFVTDDRGRIKVKNLEVGKYALIETTVGDNYGYVVSSKELEVEIEGDINNVFTVYNKQAFVDLSGYVWLDIPTGKQTVRDDQYTTADKLLEGIVVKLKDSKGNTVKNYDGKLCETKTDKNGEYSFIKVNTYEISKYHVEFTYDGLAYENVAPKLTQNNGSKAIENNMKRKEFNEKFAFISGNRDNTGYAINRAKKLEYKLQYNKDEENCKSTLSGISPSTDINSTTQDAGYKIQFTPGQEKISDINLGIYERAQIDLALGQDLLNAKISFNGYTHLYNNYGKRVYDNSDNSRFNIGVKFKGEYTDQYKQAVYESDVTQNPEDTDKEFKMYVTYKIVLNNESTNLTGVVDSIITNYDPRYKITKIGKEISEQGIITGGIIEPINIEDDKEGKVIIYTDEKIDSSEPKTIYIEFEMDRENVKEAINNKESLYCSSEIAEYHTLDNKGNLYASIDKDSNPKNFDPNKFKETIEDDSDRAPGFLIEYAAPRTIEGTVFVDTTEKEIQHLKVRQGDGEFKDGETTVAGVKVKLTQHISPGNIKEYIAETKEDGSFKIEGFIPGEYTLTYIWGDETYSVEEYKATIYKDESRLDNLKWYKTTEPRYSDALDDYKLREEIDEDNEYTIDKMNSTTPLMDMGIEYDDIKSNPLNPTNVEISGYNIKNIDFGIVERARQSVKASKNVKQVNVKLVNGQTIVDAEIIEENGERVLKGKVENTSFISDKSQQNGYFKVEMDDEIIQGATIDIVYEFRIYNDGEIDYINQQFYEFGTKNTVKDDEKIKLTPKVVDILDKDLVYNDKENLDWKVISTEKYSTEHQTGFTLTEQSGIINSKKVLADGTKIETQSQWYEAIGNAEKRTEIFEEVVKARTEQIDYGTILENEELKKAIFVGESNTAELKASKILSNQDEIELDNKLEILEIGQNGGRIINPIELVLIDNAEQVLVTPPTGEMRNYLSVGLVIISSLVIVVAGIVIIKKKVI